MRLLQLLLAIWLGVAVWFVGFGGEHNTPQVLPETEVQFSLDLEVIGSADHGLVYAVEQRARPAYRIFSLDPVTGRIETVFTVPEDAIVYGIALSPDARTLAVGYTTDFHIAGNGISLLDLDTHSFDQVTPAEPDVYVTDLEWSSDGATVLATRVDRTGPSERLDVVSISVHDGTVETIMENGVAPTAFGPDLYYLTVDDEHARRAIGRIDADGAVTVVPVGDGERDLDHLIAGPTGSTLRVAVIDSDDASVTLGEPAGAHGSHDVASTWWNVSTALPASSAPTAIEPIIVYDAASRTEAVVYATHEGLSIAEGDQRTDLIESRAIRFIAA